MQRGEQAWAESRVESEQARAESKQARAESKQAHAECKWACAIAAPAGKILPSGRQTAAR